MNAAWLIDRCLRHKAAESPYILGKRVEKLTHIHSKRVSYRKGAGMRCVLCRVPWPCMTVRILDGEDL
jgi:hypothetical protein